MKFIDDNFVSSVILHERGQQGIQLTWSCIPSRRDYQVKGFLICYMKAEALEKCCEIIERMGDEALLNKVEKGLWVFNDSEDLKIGSISIHNLEGGFQALDTVFKAPCQIRIWTVALDANNELFIMNQSKKECICYRKLHLKSKVNLVETKAKTKKRLWGLGGTKIVTPESHYTEITISLGDYNDSYIEGSIEYSVPRCKYPFPVTREMLGKTIRLEGISEVAIKLAKGFEDVYTLG